MSFPTEYQGWDVWAEKFKPVNNHLDKYATPEHPNQMFETYDEEGDYIKSLDPKYVWTNVQGDMADLLVAGVSYVNRLSYYVTEIPWDDEYDSVLLSVEAECVCYDEETGNGKDDCDACEGYGLVTVYND
jgi:hypothetical protein